MSTGLTDLPKSLEENLVTSLYFDEELAREIRPMIRPDMFSVFGRRFVEKALQYIDAHDTVPGEGHAADLVEGELNGDSKELKTLCKDFLLKMQETAPTLNRDYIRASLRRWIANSELYTLAARMAEECQAGRPEAAQAEAEKVLQEISQREQIVGDDFDELLQRNIPDPQWLVEGMISEGLCLVVGRPKSRKSLTTLHIALAVMSGGKVFGKYSVKTPGDVLVLALEDNPRRIRKRGKAIMTTFYRKLRLMGKQKGHAQVFYNWPRGDVRRLRRYVKEHPSLRLIVVDTLARFRRPSERGENSYLADYQAMAELQRLAMDTGITIIVIHHTRKTAAEDLLDEISGTTGIAAGADSIWVFKVKRGEDTGELFVTGRDHEDERALAIGWDKGMTAWEVTGNAADLHLSDERKEVLRLLDNEMSLADLVKAIGKEYHTVRYLVTRLVEDGLVRKQGNKYGRVRDESL